MAVEKIQVVPIRQAFGSEARDFTVWLENNIDALSERIGLNLTVVEREKSVGSFSLDLLCEDDGGHPVIVENQLERTDHDHLGKLLTYMVNLDAKTAIWVATDIRAEHEKVIDWLNETTAADMAFYCVKAEAIKIGDSPFAPLFTVISRPDEQSRVIGEQKKESAERHVLRYEFWSQLLDKIRSQHGLGGTRSPSDDHWLGVASGRSGIEFNYLILKDGAGIEVYIDVGDGPTNKSIFDRLLTEQDTIEQTIGQSLDWMRLDDKRSSRVRCVNNQAGGLRDQSTWPAIQGWMIDTMIRFDKAFRNRIR